MRNWGALRRQSTPEIIEQTQPVKQTKTETKINPFGRATQESARERYSIRQDEARKRTEAKEQKERLERLRTIEASMPEYQKPEWVQKIAQAEQALANTQQQQNEIFARKQEQRIADLNRVMANKDFLQYAEAGKNTVNPTWDQAARNLGELQNPVAFANQNADYLKRMQASTRGFEEAGALTVKTADLVKYTYMTQAEQNTYNYYLAKEGKEKAQEYLDALDRRLDERRQAALNEETKQNAAENKISGIVGNLVSSYFTPGAFFETIRQNVENANTGEYAPVNAYSPAMMGVHAQTATQEGVTGDIESPTLKFLADTGLSIGQNLVRYPMGPLGLGMMGLGAAGSTATEATLRGATADQALELGTIAGAAEVLTEKLPMDNFFRLLKTGSGSLKSAMLEALKQVGTEASEEMVSEYVNRIADTVIMGDLSEMNQYITELVSAGYSQEEAEKMARSEFYIKQPLLAGLGGAISGGVLGGGATLYGNTIGAAYTGRGLTESGQAVDFMEQAARGRYGEENAEYAINLMQRSKKKNKPQNRRLGVLANQAVAYEAQVTETADRLAKAFGRKVELFDKGAENGYIENGYFKDGTIYINRSSQNPIAQVFSHELTHSLEGTEGYNALQSYVLTRLQEQGVDLKQVQIQKAEQYRKAGQALPTEAAVNSELLAEYVEKNLLTNEKEVLRLARTNQSVAYRVLDWIETAIAKVTGNEEKQYLLEARNLYRKALGEMAEGQEGDQFSIAELPDGERITVIDQGQDVFEGKPVSTFASIARRELLDRFKGQYLPVSTHDLARFRARQAGEYAYPRTPLSQKSLEYEGKMRAATELDKLLETAEYSHWDKDRKNHPEATLGFDYYKVKFIVGGHLFEGLANIATSEKGRILYDITKIKEIPDISGKYATPLAQSTSAFGNLSNERIPDNAKNVKKQFSISEARDSQGNNLTAEQEAYFRDSVVRDENGNLKPLWHGTNVDFNTFEKGDIGFHFGTYEQADARSRESGNQVMMECFLNLRNPLVLETDFGMWNANRIAEEMAKQGILSNAEYRALQSIPGFAAEGYDSPGNAALRALLEAKGYDGIQYRNTFEGEENAYSYIVFHPNQVKRVNNLTPTQDPDMRFSISEERNLSEEQFIADIMPLIRKLYGADKEKTDSTESVQEAEAAEEQLEAAEAEDALTKKQEIFKQKAEKEVLRSFGNAFGISGYADKTHLQGVMDALAQEYFETGEISDKTKNEAFQLLLESAYVSDAEFAEQYKALKQELKQTPILLSPVAQKDITDLPSIRRQYFNKLQFTTEEGIRLDSYYDELSTKYPELFNPEITGAGDMVNQLLDVADSLYNTEKSLAQMTRDFEGYEQGTKENFEAALYNMKNTLDLVERQAEESRKRKTEAERFADEVANLTPERIEQLNAELFAARKQLDKVRKQNLLTSDDETVVNDLLKGKRSIDNIPDGYNKDGILAVYEARKPVWEKDRLLTAHKNRAREGYRQLAKEMTEDAVHWKDKKSGLRYDRETAERNMEDVIGDKEKAAEVVDTYFTSVHREEANNTRNKNSYRQRVKELGLSQKARYFVTFPDENKLLIRRKVSESALVQMLGEGVITIEQVKQSGADAQKIQKAVQEFRSIYAELYDAVNDALIRNGYPSAGYIPNYFPHFSENETDGVLAKIGTLLGMDVDTRELPTDIAGRTHTFKPGKQWFGNLLSREGEQTVYDALEGFDRYIEGAGNVIYHTDNIQRLRALETELRYQFSSKGIQDQIDAIWEAVSANELSSEEANGRIADLLKEGEQKFPHLVTWLGEYINNLAGKKAMVDRNMEHAMGRRWYSFAKAIENRVAANMVALNPGSWITNFIPITQVSAVVDNTTMLRAIKDAMKSCANDDGLRMKSDFLTNRDGSKPVSMTTMEKVSDKLGMGMELVDGFASDVVVRARYYQNMKDGMGEALAMEDANDFAARLMADRSKGAMPTLFNAKNPVSKLFTMFQLEVNNQFSFLFKDIPDDLRKKGLAALAAGLFKMFVGAFIYNELYEKLTGRRAALDPLDMIMDAAGDFAGTERKNVIDWGLESLEEKELAPIMEESRYPKNTYGALATTAKGVAEELPFIGGLIGGGRLPISSALPNAGNTAKAVAGLMSGEMNQDKAWSTIGKELSKPAAYIGPPIGGGQIKKAIEGFQTVREGGSYGMDSEGRPTLQFPVENQGISDYAKAMIFGKYSLPRAQEYIDSEFKSLSADNTEKYKEALRHGIDYDTFMRVYISQKEAQAEKTRFGKTVKTTGEVKKEAIDQAGYKLNDSQREFLYEAFDVPEKLYKELEEEAELPDAYKKSMSIGSVIGIDRQVFLDVYLAQRDVKGDKDRNGKTVYLSSSENKKAAIDEATEGLSRKQKEYLYEVFGVSKKVW